MTNPFNHHKHEDIHYGEGAMQSIEEPWMPSKDIDPCFMFAEDESSADEALYVINNEMKPFDREIKLKTNTREVFEPISVNLSSERTGFLYQLSWLISPTSDINLEFLRGFYREIRKVHPHINWKQAETNISKLNMNFTPKDWVFWGLCTADKLYIVDAISFYKNAISKGL